LMDRRTSPKYNKTWKTVLQDRMKHSVLTPLIIKRNYFSETFGKSIIKQIQI
jgi:hypothetical protein